MSVELPISPSLDDAHRSAVDEANRWCGRCIACFARIEEAAGLALASLVTSGRDPALRNASMFGPRLAALEQAFAVGRPFAVRGRKALKVLVAIKPWIEARNMLVHGVGAVWIRPKQEWLWVYRYTPSGQNKTPQVGQFDRSDAESMEKELGRHTRSLCDLLNNLAVSVERQGPDES